MLRGSRRSSAQQAGSKLWQKKSPIGAVPKSQKSRQGWRKRQHDLAAICHDARKSRYDGSRWSKLCAPPLYSTSFLSARQVIVRRRQRTRMCALR
jgi:hypothetical protein